MDRVDVNSLAEKVRQRRDDSPYMMDATSLYNLALDALLIIAGTLVDVDVSARQPSGGRHPA